MCVGVGIWGGRMCVGVGIWGGRTCEEVGTVFEHARDISYLMLTQ